MGNLPSDKRAKTVIGSDYPIATDSICVIDHVSDRLSTPRVHRRAIHLEIFCDGK